LKFLPKKMKKQNLKKKRLAVERQLQFLLGISPLRAKKNTSYFESTATTRALFFIFHFA